MLSSVQCIRSAFRRLVSCFGYFTRDTSALTKKVDALILSIGRGYDNRNVFEIRLKFSAFSLLGPVLGQKYATVVRLMII